MGSFGLVAFCSCGLTDASMTPRREAEFNGSIPILFAPKLAKVAKVDVVSGTGEFCSETDKFFLRRPSVCTRTEQLLHGGFLASVDRRRDEELSSPAMFIKVCSYPVEFSPHTGIPVALGCCFTLVHDVGQTSPRLHCQRLMPA